LPVREQTSQLSARSIRSGKNTPPVIGLDEKTPSDWPIVEEKSVPERLHKAFAHPGLSAAEQQMIASGNTLRLLGIG
jgi:hypothetical protein